MLLPSNDEAALPVELGDEAPVLVPSKPAPVLVAPPLPLPVRVAVLVRVLLSVAEDMVVLRLMVMPVP